MIVGQAVRGLNKVTKKTNNKIDINNNILNYFGDNKVWRIYFMHDADPNCHTILVGMGLAVSGVWIRLI